MNKDQSAQLMFETLVKYAKMHDVGHMARPIVQELAQHYLPSPLDIITVSSLPHCYHCKGVDTVLAGGYNREYHCENARECYKENVINEFVSGYTVSIRQYRRNTFISYNDGKNFKRWAKFENDSFDLDESLGELQLFLTNSDDEEKRFKDGKIESNIDFDKGNQE